MWLQDWVGKRVTTFGEQLWWTWQLDRVHLPRLEPDGRGTCTQQGIHVMTYVNPFVIDADEVDGHPIRNYLQGGRAARATW